MKKISTILTIMMLIIVCSSNIIYGFSLSDITGEEPSSSVKSSINNFGQGIISIISTVGSIISVVVLVLIGIKYMMGSVEERAEYKKSLLPYFIGACILFGASTLASVIYNIIVSM